MSPIVGGFLALGLGLSVVAAEDRVKARTSGHTGRAVPGAAQGPGVGLGARCARPTRSG